MRQTLRLIIFFALSISYHFSIAQTGTADGTYVFNNLGTDDSGGSQFKTQGDKFKISNSYVDDGSQGLYDASAGQVAGQQSTLIIKAEGTTVCKKFTLKDIALYTYAGGTEIAKAYSTFTIVVYNTTGNPIATHSISSNVNIGKNAILKLKDIPFTNAWPAAGYANVAEIRITFVAVGSKPEILGFSNITVADISANTLPVNLISYEIQKANNYAEISWKTASEQNNKSFVIYRSGDDKQFVKIGELDGNGTTNTANKYTFYDRDPLSGNNYYKLIQLDKNGKTTQLGEKALNFDISELSLKIYPNPTSDLVNINFGNKKYSKVTLSDISGKILNTVNITNSRNSINLNLSSYPRGMYLIHLASANGTTVQRIVKNN
jgi:hypothetical protein